MHLMHITETGVCCFGKWQCDDIVDIPDGTCVNRVNIKRIIFPLNAIMEYGSNIKQWHHCATHARAQPISMSPWNTQNTNPRGNHAAMNAVGMIRHQSSDSMSPISLNTPVPTTTAQRGQCTCARKNVEAPP